MSNIIDGKKIAKELEKNLKKLVIEQDLHPCLKILTCCPDDASKIYLRNKKKACARVGIDCEVLELDEQTTTIEILHQINIWNEDKNTHGIIVQLPLPKQIDVLRVQQAISREKDVDGFHPNSDFIPCTPEGCLILLNQEGISVAGKHCVVVGRSKIVGMPLSQLLLRENATVSICHSHTTSTQLKEICKTADFIFCCAGVPNLIKKEYLKQGVIIIDISINRGEDGKICGDMAEDCKEICSYYTPVPGGIGPMTVYTLLYHTVEACCSAGIDLPF